MRHFTEYKQFAFQVRISYGAYLTDLAKKLLSRRIFSYLCAEWAISASMELSLGTDSYLCAHSAIYVQR